MEERLLAALSGSGMELRNDPAEERTEYRLCRVLESGAFSPVAPDELPGVGAHIAADLRALDQASSVGGAELPLSVDKKDALLLRLDMLDGWLHEIAHLERLASDQGSAHSPLESPFAGMLPIQPLDLAALGHPTPKRQRRMHPARTDHSPRPGPPGTPGCGAFLSPGLQVPAAGYSHLEAGALGAAFVGPGGGGRPLLAKSPQVRHRVRRPGQARLLGSSDREFLATWGQRRHRVRRAHPRHPGAPGPATGGHAQGSAWRRIAAELLRRASVPGPSRSLASSSPSSGVPAPPGNAAVKPSRRARRPEVAVALAATSSPGPFVPPGASRLGSTSPTEDAAQASGAVSGARPGDLYSRSHAAPDLSGTGAAAHRDGAKRRRVVSVPGSLGGGSPLVSPRRRGSDASEVKTEQEPCVKATAEQAPTLGTRSGDHAAEGDTAAALDRAAATSSQALGSLSPRTRTNARATPSLQLADPASPSSGPPRAPALDATPSEQLSTRDAASVASGSGEAGAKGKGRARAPSLLPPSSVEAGAASSPSAVLKSRRQGPGLVSSPRDARQALAEPGDTGSVRSAEGKQKRASKVVQEGAAGQGESAVDSTNAALGHGQATTGPIRDAARSRARPKAKRNSATDVSPPPGGVHEGAHLLHADTSTKPIQGKGATGAEPARVQGAAGVVSGGAVAEAGVGSAGGGSKRRRRPNRKYADSEFHDLEEFDVAWAELEGAKLPLDEPDWKPLEASDLDAAGGLAALDTLGSAGGTVPAASTAARPSDAARSQPRAKPAAKAGAGAGASAAKSVPARAPPLAPATNTLGLVPTSGLPGGAKAGSKQQVKQQVASDKGRSAGGAETAGVPSLSAPVGAAKVVPVTAAAGSGLPAPTAAGAQGARAFGGASIVRRQARPSGQPRSIYGSDWVTEGSETDELLDELHSSTGEEPEEQPWGALSPQPVRPGNKAPVAAPGQGAQGEHGAGKGQKRKKPSAPTATAQERAKPSRPSGVQPPTKSKPSRPPGSSPTKPRPYIPVTAAASEERPIASLAGTSSGALCWHPEGTPGAPGDVAKRESQSLGSPGSFGRGGLVGGLGSGGSGEESDSGVGPGSRTSSGARILEELDGGDEAERGPQEGDMGGEGEGGASRDYGQVLWQARASGLDTDQGTPKKRDATKAQAGPGSPAANRIRRPPKEKQSEGESGGEAGSAGSGGPRGGGTEGGGEDSRIYTANGGIRRKHHRPWTLREVLTLVDGVAKCGGGKWADIKKLSFAAMGYRTAVDLKDKWRNLLRASRLATQSGKEGETSARKKQMSAAIPAHVLQRVRELSQLQQQQQPGDQPHPPLQPLLAMHEQEQQRQHAEAQRFEQQAHVSVSGGHIQDQGAQAPLGASQLGSARPELEQLQEQQRQQWQQQEGSALLQAAPHGNPQILGEHGGLGGRMHLEGPEQGQREDEALGPLGTPTIPSLASLAELDSTFGDEFDQLLPL